MRLHERGEVVVGHAERGGAVYDLSRPHDEIAAGALLELIDFRDAARSIGAKIGLGTEAFKLSIRGLTGPHRRYTDECPDLDPFCQVWRLPGDGSRTIYFDDITLDMSLSNYYIKTQALKDFYDGLVEDKKSAEYYGKRTFEVVRSVIYDDQDMDLI